MQLSKELIQLHKEWLELQDRGDEFIQSEEYDGLVSVIHQKVRDYFELHGGDIEEYWDQLSQERWESRNCQ